jgi:phosphoglycolate phosphatase
MTVPLTAPQCASPPTPGLAYQLLSFDLDGTLVDTAAEIAQAAHQTLIQHGVPVRPVAEITQLIGEGSRALMLKLLARCFLAQPALADHVRTEAVLADFEQCLGQTLGSSAQPYPGVPQALARLQQAGLRLACVSNKEEHLARRLLHTTGLERWFELVVGGDTLPEKKPHGSVLRHVLQRLQAAPERSAHIGDSHIDVAAARQAGVHAWAVPYGYNGGEPIATARPDRIFPTLQQLAEHVLGHAAIPPATGH